MRAASVRSWQSVHGKFPRSPTRYARPPVQGPRSRGHDGGFRRRRSERMPRQMHPQGPNGTLVRTGPTLALIGRRRLPLRLGISFVALLADRLAIDRINDHLVMITLPVQ